MSVLTVFLGKCRGMPRYFPKTFDFFKNVLFKFLKSLGKYLGIPRHFSNFTYLLSIFTLKTPKKTLQKIPSINIITYYFNLKNILYLYITDKYSILTLYKNGTTRTTLYYLYQT